MKNLILLSLLAIVAIGCRTNSTGNYSFDNLTSNQGIAINIYQQDNKTEAPYDAGKELSDLFDSNKSADDESIVDIGKKKLAPSKDSIKDSPIKDIILKESKDKEAVEVDTIDEIKNKLSEETEVLENVESVESLEPLDPVESVEPVEEL